AAPAARLPSPAPAGWAPRAQTASATSAPNSVTYRPHRLSLDWTALRAPAARCAPAAPSVAGFSRPAAGLLRPPVLPHLTEFHSGGPAYAPRKGHLFLYYTANELARHGTSPYLIELCFCLSVALCFE